MDSSLDDILYLQAFCLVKKGMEGEAERILEVLRTHEISQELRVATEELYESLTN